MELHKLLQKELLFLNKHMFNSVMISTTAKHALEFKVLPRRVLENMAMSCFMINNKQILEETLSFFDGKVKYIYIDIEQKQELNLFNIAKEIIKKSQLITAKPNDITIESCDLLIRNQFKDDLCNKKIVVIGTGNLACKIAIKLAERQAQVYLLGRTIEKSNKIRNALNLFLPKNTPQIEIVDQNLFMENVDVIVSFISGQFTDNKVLLPFINDKTLIIDGGINNFSSEFIQEMLLKKVKIIRLDTRIALPYQILSVNDYTRSFFSEILGTSLFDGVEVAAGGYLGQKGTVIVDNIKQPTQVIGIADGNGGVIPSEQHSEEDRNRVQKIEKAISTIN